IGQGRDADPTVGKVLRVKADIQKYEGIYQILTNIAHSDDMIRRRKDREIRAGDLSPRERQKEQADRDIAFVSGLKECVSFLKGLLRKGIARLEKATAR
ncbi:MAG: hypothetical protein RDV41_00240, partial [Planctomycetota bacterium]|nr:hypothetical protein [Planctomycetota bacterium]